MITRTQEDLRPLAYDLAIKAGLSETEAKKRLGTTTTTNLDKLKPRMTRGDLGGCPFLIPGKVRGAKRPPDVGPTS